LLRPHTLDYCWKTRHLSTYKKWEPHGYTFNTKWNTINTFKLDIGQFMIFQTPQFSLRSDTLITTLTADPHVFLDTRAVTSLLHTCIAPLMVWAHKQVRK
jgi:hypothetical protein